MIPEVRTRVGTTSILPDELADESSISVRYGPGSKRGKLLPSNGLSVRQVSLWLPFDISSWLQRIRCERRSQPFESESSLAIRC